MGTGGTGEVTLDDNVAALVGAAAAVGHVAIAVAVTVHVLLYKRSVGALVSWIGIAWLSPFLGGLLYAIMGINRVKRRALRLKRQHTPLAASASTATVARDSLTPLEYAVGRLTGLPSKPGNIVEMLRSGDEAYPRMLGEIGRAELTVGLCSYIFRADSAGEKFHEALIEAQRRGVKVRVLIDGVGGGYFWSGTYNRLRQAGGVPVARFLHSYFPWRTPFVNLRNHRKLLVIDGQVAFTGGLNIGAEGVTAENPAHPVRDTHFRIEGPVVEQLTDAFAEDWQFTTGEQLDDDWFPTLEPVGTVMARVVPSGPDEDMEQIEFVAARTISCARRSIRVVTPLLPAG